MDTAVQVATNGHVVEPYERAQRVLAALDQIHAVPRPWVEGHEFCDEPAPDREWLIPDLIQRQGRILLAGPEGCGKSLLSLTLGVQAAAGIAVLDSFPVPVPLRVVYLDLEMARASTRSRLRQLRISAKDQLSQGAIYLQLRPEGIDLTEPREASDLLHRLEILEADLLVIDPLYKMMLTDAIYERDVRPTLRVLDQVRVARGCGIILIHHLRKRAQGEVSRGRDGSDIFGSSVLRRWPDTTMILTEETLRVDKDRDNTFGDIKSFPVKRGGVWPISLAEPHAALTEDVFDYVDTFGPITANGMTRDMGRRRKDVYNALRELERAGRVAKKSDKWEAVA